MMTLNFRFALFAFCALTAISIFPGCQVYNSSSQDEQRFAGGSPEEKARGVLAVRCAACHAFHTTSLTSLMNTGHVVPGQPASSTLLTRIRGAGLGGTENMPPSDSVSAAEIDTIKVWIEGVQAP
jgi:uncharacterized membrane protein